MKKQILIAIYLISCSLHGMKKSSALSPEELERKEQELFARMEAMRLEQALRTQQPEVTFVKVAEYSCEGVSAQDLVNELKKMSQEKKKESTEPEKLLACFSTDHATPLYIAENKQKGYLVFKRADGVTVFCLPGHEDKLKILLAGYNHFKAQDFNN